MAKNFPKACDDLFKKDFVHDKPWQFAINHGKGTPTFKENLSVNTTGNLIGSIVNTIDHPLANTTLTIGTDGQLAIQATAPVAYHKGLSVSALLKCKPAGSSKGVTDSSVEILLKGAPLTWKAKFNPLQNTWTTHAAICRDAKLKQESLFLSFDVSGKFEKDVLTQMKPSFAAVVKKPVQDCPMIFGCKGSHHGKTPFGKLSIFGVAKGAKSECGYEYTYIREEEKSEFTVGAQWTLNPENGSAFKFKVDNEGKLSTAFTTSVSPNASVTFGGQFDAVSKFKPGCDAEKEHPKFGIRFNLTA